MEKVLVPEKVFNAFENLKRDLAHLDNEQKNFMFLNICSIGHSEDQQVLKQYAADNPTKYLQCLVYGYALDKKEILKEMIAKWVDDPVEDDLKKDMELFADKVFNLFNQKL